MASSPQHEPTMEEILASIRKIISEDSTEAPPAPVATAAVAPVQEADVLELTQEMPEEHAPAPAAPARPPVAVPKPESDAIPHTEEETTVASSSPVLHDDIFSDKTRKAFDDTFANIPDSAPARPSQRGTSAGLGGPDGSSVEAVFERAVTSAFDPVLDQWMDRNKSDLLDAVKPLIREWMDEHFPALLEGVVRNEVERVVKARGNKR